MLRWGVVAAVRIRVDDRQFDAVLRRVPQGATDAGNNCQVAETGVK